MRHKLQRVLSNNASLLAIVVLAATLRVVNLGTQSYWYDEAVSVSTVLLDWPAFITRIMKSELNMVFYHVVLRVWVAAFGVGEAATRALSTVWSVATLPVLFALGARLFGRRVGLLAALFLAVNAFHVFFAQDTRGYSMTAFFFTLAMYLFVRAVDTQSPRLWVGYSLAAAGATYSHFFGAFIFPVTWGTLVFLRRRDIPWKRLIASTALAAALLVPLVVDVAVIYEKRGQLDWIPPTRLRSIVRLANAFAGAGGFYGLPTAASGLTLGTAAKRGLLVLYTSLVLMGLWALRTSWRLCGRSPSTWRIGLAYTWLGLPTLVTLAASFLKPLFIARYLALSQPALMLIAALSISHLRSLRLRVVVTSVIVLLGTYGVVLYQREAKKEDWRGFTRYLLSQAQSGDAVLFYPPWAGTGFRFYYRQWRSRPGAPEVALVRDLDQIAAPTTRIWFALAWEDLFGHGPQLAEIQRQLAAFDVEATKDFRPDAPVRIIVYRRAAPSSP